MEYTIHEVANLFPMMTNDEFTALVEDIQANGQREPITVYENQIIDGRNRYKACQQLGFETNVKEWDGQGSLISFVVSLNLKRRHLSSTQKSAIYPEMSLMYEKEAKERADAGRRKGAEVTNSGGRISQKIDESDDINEGRATAQASKVLGVNRQYLSDAKKIHETAPELIPMMKSGELNINIAKQYASLPQETREKLLDNLPNQEEGKTKACRACGELLPIEKFPPNSSQCYPCRHVKYKKKDGTPVELEVIDEKQEWLDSQVSTFNSHLNQVIMFLERNDNLDEIIEQGVVKSESRYIEAVTAFNTILNALEKKIKIRRVK